MLDTVFKKRFSELESQYNSFNFVYRDGNSYRTVKSGEWQKWATSAQNLILSIFGEKSPHYQNFLKTFNNNYGYESDLERMHGVFLSAKEDFEGGYVFNVTLQVSGEIFGDFIVLAKQALSENNKNVAAVLACAALEDTLKKYAEIKGLDVSDKTMQSVVGALKSEGLVSGAQKSLLDTMPKIRDYAMHANWDKISEPDVNSVIGFVEQFLLTNF